MEYIAYMTKRDDPTAALGYTKVSGASEDEAYSKAIDAFLAKSGVPVGDDELIVSVAEAMAIYLVPVDDIVGEPSDYWPKVRAKYHPHLHQ